MKTEGTDKRKRRVDERWDIKRHIGDILSKKKKRFHHS